MSQATKPILTGLRIGQESFPVFETMESRLVLGAPAGDVRTGNLQKFGRALEFVRNNLPVARCLGTGSKLR
ncbi:MAG: hypothetical protein EXS22_04580 [Pedosphaera sp.]|nr:hypothetical protein [Pedosphaera sp.]MSU43304.1 hypothetical protein [Pedosphaera sp.]